MMKSRLWTLCLVAICFAATSCNGYEKVLKSNDFEAKYALAMQYYEENSYSKAIQLFENLVMYYRGKEHTENILWYYANALLKEEDYYTAAYQFKRFSRQFPYSTHVEEAVYLSAYCKYLQSLAHTLDQSQTKEAVDEFERFAERYPQSVHIPEVNKYLDELREKLMLKEYDIAIGYYTIEAYHAAYISLGNFINLYPDSPKREEAMFYQLRSGFEYGINSTDAKMKERLQQTTNDFEKFVASFPESKYLSEAQSIYTKSKAALANLEEKQKEKKQ